MKATASKSLGEVARENARIQGQPAVKDEDGVSSDGSGPLLNAKVCTHGVWTSTPPFAHADRPFNVAKWTVGRITPGGKSCEILRCAMEFSNRAWDVPQGCTRTPAPFGRKRQSRGCPGRLLKRLLHPESSTLPYFAASCRRDRHRAAFGPRKLRAFHRCPNGWRQLTPARTRQAIPTSFRASGTTTCVTSHTRQGSAMGRSSMTCTTEVTL